MRALLVLLALSGCATPELADPAGASRARLLESPTTRLEVSGGDDFGWTVRGAGDVNGDGYADVAVNAPYTWPSIQWAGAAHVFHGAAAGITTTPATSVYGVSHAGVFGYGLAAGFDVNGDGYDDLAAASPTTGLLAVYHGGPSGVSDTAAVEISQPDGTYFGGHLAAAGDVNGDGYDDLLVGAVSDDTGGGDAGRVYVFHGSASGLSTAPSRMLTGPSDNAYLGRALDGAGDVNGDGYDDVVIAAPEADNAYPDAGKVYVHLGSASGVQAAATWTWEGDATIRYAGYAVGGIGDVNADGYADIGLSSIYGYTWVFHGSATGLGSAPDAELTGTDAAASELDGADVNGDGYDDLVVGVADGNVTLYQGSDAGISTTPDSTASPVVGGSGFGRSVSNAGDVDGDGHDDVIVGAYVESTYSGAAYLFHGYAEDLDSDGSGVDVDCDDADPTVHPGAEDFPGDGIDQDCDGEDAVEDTDVPEDTDLPEDTDAPEDTDPADTDAPADTDDGGGNGPPDDRGKGCGRCDSGSPGAGWLALALGAAGLGRRQRRMLSSTRS